jgi:hypothetical protein
VITRRSLIIGIIVVLIVWPGTVVLGALAQNPFKVATEAAAATANWPLRDVRFRNGSYTALPFVFLTRAEVAVLYDDSERRAVIEVFHVPLLDYWSVRRFEENDQSFAMRRISTER